MSHYHVFLPPSLLAPLDQDQDDKPLIPKLVFEEILVPRDVQSQFTWDPTPSQRLDLSANESQDPPSQADTSATPGGSLIKRKRDHSTDLGLGDHADLDKSRGASIKRSRGALRGSASTSIMSEPDSGSRRRSARLDKSASISGTGTGLLGTFPNVGLDTTLLLGCTTNNDESFMSLNTTVSNPSQFPPTADQSSVLNLPRWSIPLTKLTPLSTLLSSSTSSKSRTESSQATLSISTIVCVLSVDQPVLRKRKEEKARGRDGTLWIGNWNVTAPPDGDTGGEVGGCAVKLWDNAAKEWGDERVRKGDVVLLENVSFKPASSATRPRAGQSSDDSPQITISDQSRPRITILYRTLPRYHTPGNDYIYTSGPDLTGITRGGGGKVLPEDKALRPDLRLARSDLGVRKVKEVSWWFAGLVGGHVPP